jgi:hypothetical protein
MKRALILAAVALVVLCAAASRKSALAGQNVNEQLQSKSLTGVVRAIGSPPKASRKGAAERVADLSITLRGGKAGSPAKATFSVVLNAAVTAEGTAELVDEAEPSRHTPGTRTRNGYVFKNVEFSQPGPTISRTFRITNIRANATGLGGGSTAGATPVIASVVISTTTIPIHLSDAKQVVALVPR